jgi:hypothetical protein
MDAPLLFTGAVGHHLGRDETAVDGGMHPALRKPRWALKLL